MIGKAHSSDRDHYVDQMRGNAVAAKQVGNLEPAVVLA